jgi:hypothetical protein
MPARRRQLLAFFRQCLWRSRLGRLSVETLLRLQYLVGSALDRDAGGLSGRGLIIVVIAVDMRHLSESVGAAPRRRLTS